MTGSFIATENILKENQGKKHESYSQKCLSGRPITLTVKKAVFWTCNVVI